jgi:hypothetical protein
MVAVPQLAEVVLQGCARQQQLAHCPHLVHGLRNERVEVLNLVALVQHQEAPHHLGLEQPRKVPLNMVKRKRPSSCGHAGVRAGLGRRLGRRS